MNSQSSNESLNGLYVSSQNEDAQQLKGESWGIDIIFWLTFIEYSIQFCFIFTISLSNLLIFGHQILLEPYSDGVTLCSKTIFEYYLNYLQVDAFWSIVITFHSSSFSFSKSKLNDIQPSSCARLRSKIKTVTTGSFTIKFEA